MGRSACCIRCAAPGPRAPDSSSAISWDAALDEIHARISEVIDRWGPQAVMPLNYAGPHGFLAGDSMSSRFFHKLGATPALPPIACAAACAARPGPEPMARCPAARPSSPSMPSSTSSGATTRPSPTCTSSAASARPSAPAASWSSSIRCARRSPSRRISIWHLLPGTDVLLAWSLAAELERSGALDTRLHRRSMCWAPRSSWRRRGSGRLRARRQPAAAASQIRTFAQWLAEADPLVFAPGNGLERGRNGGSGIRALIALPALLGKLGKGSGIVLGASNAFPKTPGEAAAPGPGAAGTRTLNIIDIGRHLADDDIDPPLRALFIYNHNPIVVHPDQNRMRRGLARDDVFAVGIELTMTESMTHCDVVLPAATHFEYADLYPSYGHHWLQRAEPVIPPAGESLPNTEIFRRLAARFGFDEPCFKAIGRGTDGRCGRYRRSAAGRREAERDPDRTRAADEGPGRQADGPVRQHLSSHASGKIELKSETLAKRWGAAALMPAWRERAGLLSADADFAGLGQAHLLDARRSRRVA